MKTIRIFLSALCISIIFFDINAQGPSANEQKPNDSAAAKNQISAITEQLSDQYIEKAGLVTESLAGSKVVNRKDDVNLGFTELTLGNGVKVVLKNTDLKKDEVLLSAYSLGGYSVYTPEKQITAYFSPDIIKRSGIGKYESSALKEKLEGKKVEITPWIDDIKEGINGNSSTGEIKTLLELTYLYFTQPRKDDEALKKFTADKKKEINLNSSNPVALFNDTLNKIIAAGKTNSVVIPKDRDIENINIDDVYNIYQERFANASDFNFFIVGDFNINEITPMIETYLGTLPVNDKKENWERIPDDFPIGIKEVEINIGNEQKSTASIIMSGKFQWSTKNNLSIRIMANYLSAQILKSIQANQEDISDLQVTADTKQFPDARYSIEISYACAPKNAVKISKTVFKEILNIQKNGPGEEDLDAAKEGLIKERQIGLRTNKFWMSKMESVYFNNEEVLPIKNYYKDMLNVSDQDIKEAAVNYLSKDNYVQVIMNPSASDKYTQTK